MKNKINLQTIWSLLLLTLISVTGCEYSQKNEDQERYSDPFLILDFEQTGIEFIPFEESQALFDVDGDGVDERIAWVKPTAHFMMFLNRAESVDIEPRRDRILTGTQRGFDFLLHPDRDIDADNDFDADDGVAIQKIPNNITRFISSGVLIDDTGDGQFLEIASSVWTFCKSNWFSKDKSVDEQPANGVNVTAYGTLHCEDRTFRIVEARFQYSDLASTTNKTSTQSSPSIKSNMSSQNSRILLIDVDDRGIEITDEAALSHHVDIDINALGESRVRLKAPINLLIFFNYHEDQTIRDPKDRLSHFIGRGFDTILRPDTDIDADGDYDLTDFEKIRREPNSGDRKFIFGMAIDKDGDGVFDETPSIRSICTFNGIRRDAILNRKITSDLTLISEGTLECDERNFTIFEMDIRDFDHSYFKEGE
ncbi:MAG: hypothetical protein ROR55_17820 [Devosia sp.]